MTWNITFYDAFISATLLAVGGYMFADANHTGEGAVMVFALLAVTVGAIWLLLTVTETHKLQHHLNYVRQRVKASVTLPETFELKRNHTSGDLQLVGYTNDGDRDG